MAIKIKNKIELLKRNVPKDIIDMEPFDIQSSLDHFDLLIDNKVRDVAPSNQFKVFKKTYNTCNSLSLDEHWTYFICGQTDAKKARFCAALLMDSYYQHCRRLKERGDPVRLPYWATLYGFKDKLLEKETQVQFGIPGLLVIDCLYANATNGKIERARDLLNMFSHIPTILIGCGSNPVDLAKKQLYVMPNKMMWFQDSFETTSI